MSTDAPPLFTSSLRVRNAHATPVTLILEPWGETYTLAGFESVDLLLESVEPGMVEVEHTADILTVWGWTGAYLTVRQGGHLRRDGRAGFLPVPDVPA